MHSWAVENDLLDFVETMNCAASVDEAWRKIVTFMRGLGASHVGTLFDPKVSEFVHLSTSPSCIRELYREEVYPDHDQTLEHCKKNLTPAFFGKEFWHLDPDIPVRRRRFDEELVSIGTRAAVAVPLHAHANNVWGFVAFRTNLRGDEFDRFFDDYGPRIQLGAITALSRIYALARNEQAEYISLTEREVECLQWLARGLRNDRIAHRMSITQATVEFHLANARRKLNARTRGQALVNALQLGLIEP